MKMKQLQRRKESRHLSEGWNSKESKFSLTFYRNASHWSQSAVSDVRVEFNRLDDWAITQSMGRGRRVSMAIPRSHLLNVGPGKQIYAH